MLKFMLTTICNRDCPYCITKNVVSKEEMDMKKVRQVLSSLRNKHSSIMITGGEPTMANLFKEKVLCAKKIFDEVYLTSQNIYVLKNTPLMDNFKAITFSLHDLKTIPKVENDVPVYASILDYQYHKDLSAKLRKLGYKGLTINENQRHKKAFTEKIPKLKNFSILINRVGKCLDEDIVLPNLEVINNFRKYL